MNRIIWITHQQYKKLSSQQTKRQKNTLY